MRKIKMALAMILSICLLTACGGQTTKQSPDLSNAFTEESKPKVSQDVIDAMARYEEAIDSYCEAMDLWFQLDVSKQAQLIDRYVAMNDELAHNQETMQELMDHEEAFNEADYAYIQQTALRCSQKLLNCASGGLEAAEEALNGEGSNS